MNKLIKVLTPVLMVCLLLSSLAVHSFADDGGITPRYTNTHVCRADFAVMDGAASIFVKYNGIATEFTRADITVKIQKRFLLVFWNDVDIGYANNEWTSTCTDLNGTFLKDFPISKTGYYRALITVNVYGISGDVDTIEVTLEYDYR